MRGKPVAKGDGIAWLRMRAGRFAHHRFNSALSVAASVAGAGWVSLLTGATDKASTATDSTGELGIAVGWAARLALRGASVGADLKSSAKSATGELRLVPLGVASSALFFVGIS